MLNSERFVISIAAPTELYEIGDLMAKVYSRLDGFPSREAQPSYYDQFYNLSELTFSRSVDVVVAKNQHNAIMGGVVYFSDMKCYGAGGEATTSIANSSGIRLLAVSSEAQGNGIGRRLTEYCVELARKSSKSRVILHTTQYMPAAWKLYESIGFRRYADIDFKQAELEVFGFQLSL